MLQDKGHGVGGPGAEPAEPSGHPTQPAHLRDQPLQPPGVPRLGKHNQAGELQLPPSLNLSSTLLKGTVSRD